MQRKSDIFAKISLPSPLLQRFLHIFSRSPATFPINFFKLLPAFNRPLTANRATLPLTRPINFFNFSKVFYIKTLDLCGGAG